MAYPDGNNQHHDTVSWPNRNAPSAEGGRDDVRTAQGFSEDSRPDGQP